MKIKHALSFISVFLVIGLIFSVCGYASSFPSNRIANQNRFEFSHCESVIKKSFIEISNKRKEPFDKERLNVVVKKVCDCVRERREKEKQFKKAVSQCIKQLPTS